MSISSPSPSPSPSPSTQNDSPSLSRPPSRTESWQAKWVPTPTLRVVRIGNLPPSATVQELLNLVHFGPIERISFVPQWACIYLTFLEASTAADFFADARRPRLTLDRRQLTVGWGRPSTVPPEVDHAVAKMGASRAVFLGDLEKGLTQIALREELRKFGPIDEIKIVRDENIGFVHFFSVSVAIKVVETLRRDPAWGGKRIAYAADRCGHVKSQQAVAHQSQAPAAQSLVEPFASSTGAHSTPLPALGNRTVYLRNIHPRTTTADLCNVIRGGLLESMWHEADMGFALVNFIDSAAASTFMQVSTTHGLTLHTRRLQVSWGKRANPLSLTLKSAVQGGATRSVYIGKVRDFELFSEGRLKADFGKFGDIERVQLRKEQNCAFVDFTMIWAAILAIDGIKNHPEYANLRIAHGKDPCANPPWSGPQGASGARRSASGNGPNSAEPVSAVEPEGEMDFDEAAQAEAEDADVPEVKQEPQQEGMLVEGGVASSS
ncbi:hypothetical protein DFH09DRAFT_992720, partial [Mycena vulgaris]